MIRRPPISTRTYTLFPFTTLFRSLAFVFTIVGLILSIIANGQSKAAGYKNGPAKAGIIISIIFIVLGIIGRSEEHTSELQSLMRISYAVFCLKKNKTHTHHNLYSLHIDYDLDSQTRSHIHV